MNTPNTSVIKDLEEKIVELNNAYRAGNPMVTDEEYDNFVDTLRRMDPDNSIFKTGIIESSKSGSRKQKLPIPMYSLDKCKSAGEIMAWIINKGLTEDTEIVITPKYNGISMVVDFNTDGYRAFTRGDGEYGQRSDKHFDLTNGTTFLSNDIVFGEMIISQKNWERHFQNKTSPKGLLYKLNHSTVAGMFNNDEPPAELKYVDFKKYGVSSPKTNELNYLDQIIYLDNSSNDSIDWYITRVKFLNEELADELYQLWKTTYPIDGLVIQINSSEIRNKLGRELNMNPAYARALKLDKWSGAQETVITDHEFQISKQGKLKGVVKFNPIYFEGSQVNQATFYNARFLIDFGLSEFTKISVKKSGDIIPKIVSVEDIIIPLRENFKNENEYKKAYREAIDKISEIQFSLKLKNPDISHCPYCGHILNWDDSMVELVCKNQNCKGIKLSKIEHFFVTSGVEEFGRPSIEALYEYGYDTIFKILSITHKELSNIPGFGEASASVILKEFSKLINPGISLAKLMHAMDVFEGTLGEKVAQTIFDNLPDEFPNYNLDMLLKIKGVGERVATQFLISFNQFRDEFIGFEHLISINQITTPKTQKIGSKYEGMAVCFSGLRDKELEDEIVKQGGKIASGVSKTTTHLIVADVNQNTSKTIKARELNIPVMTIEQFKITLK